MWWTDGFGAANTSFSFSNFFLIWLLPNRRDEQVSAASDTCILVGLLEFCFFSLFPYWTMLRDTVILFVIVVDYFEDSASFLNLNMFISHLVLFVWSTFILIFTLSARPMCNSLAQRPQSTEFPVNFNWLDRRLSQ